MSFSPSHRKKDPRSQKEDRRDQQVAVFLVERGRRLLPVGDFIQVCPRGVERGPVKDRAVRQHHGGDSGVRCADHGPAELDPAGQRRVQVLVRLGPPRRGGALRQAKSRIPAGDSSRIAGTSR